MAVVGLDLGVTRLATGVFTERGQLLTKTHVPISGHAAGEIGEAVTEEIQRLLKGSVAPDPIRAVGVCVPGIYNARTGRVWAPNLPGWDDYPLRDELTRAVGPDVMLRIDNDRSCSILGETWRGIARGSRNAIFLSVGTGIGAGILVDGRVLRGQNDIGGAVGWMAMSRPFHDEYGLNGSFEYHASGAGLVRVAKQRLAEEPDVPSVLRGIPDEPLTAQEVFAAHAGGDPIAVAVIENAIAFWGMGVANLVSVFNPEKIIFGGGVFGPAAAFLDDIRREAAQWAQPISMEQVTIEVSTLGFDAPLYGAGRLALKRTKSQRSAAT